MTPSSQIVRNGRRIPIRTKITLPYIILAFGLVLSVGYVIARIVVDSVEERFTNNLIEAGQLTSEWMVLEEARLLETLRLISRTQGVAEAISADDPEWLKELIFPVAVNSLEEAVDVIDSHGTSLLALRHIPGGNIEDYEISGGGRKS